MNRAEGRPFGFVTFATHMEAQLATVELDRTEPFRLRVRLNTTTSNPMPSLTVPRDPLNRVVPLNTLDLLQCSLSLG